MHSEILARFMFRGQEFDPSLMTAELGLEPTRTWRKGDRTRGPTRAAAKSSGWELESGLGRNADLESHVVAILKQLEGHESSIAETCQRHGLQPELSCVIYSYDGDRPVIHFDQRTVRKLSEIGAFIDVDLYVL